MTRLLHDLRFALRGLVQRPGFNLLVIGILGLGMGAATAVVDLTNLLAWRRIPVAEAGEVVKVFTARHRGFVSPYRWTGYPDYLDYRDAAGSFSGLVALTDLELRVDDGATTRTWSGAAVSGNLFEVLRLRPALGRGIGPGDDRPGAEPVAVLSHHAWKRRGADPEVLGSRLVVEGRSFTVVGVGPEGFRTTVAGTLHDLYLPIAALPSVAPGGADLLERRDRGNFQVLGRLAAGEGRGSAQTELDLLARRLDEAHPLEDGKPRRITVTGAGIVHPVDLARMAPTLRLFAAAVALLLVITCANVAHLMLARAAGRRREMAVRLAIGAGRGALIRQLLAESFPLALGGGAVGLALARGARFFLLSYAGPEFAGEMRFDLRVFAVTFLLCMAVTFLFGLAPAWSATRVDLTTALKDGAPGVGRRRFTAGRWLAAGQVALCVVLLTAGALLVESLRNRLGADLGIDDDHLLIASLSLREEDYDRERGEALFRELRARAAALPGVESSAFAMIVPPLLFDVTVPVGLPGEADDVATIRLNFVDLEYFGTVDITLLRGRLFEPTDGPESRPVVVVNERLAATLWPGEEALGRTLRMQGSSEDPGPDHLVIGVVTNVSQHGVHRGGEPLAYFSYRQRYRPSRQLVVRSALVGTLRAEEALAESLRATLRELDPELALTSIRNGEKNRRNAFLFERMQTQAVGVFAVLGFVLAVVGIFGLLSHAVSLRVREIGVRMAVGASAADVRRQVVGEGVRLALLGAAVGLLATLAAGRFLESLLYGISAAEPWVMAAVTAVAVASSAAAAYLPARRASRLDPLDALRYE